VIDDRLSRSASTDQQTEVLPPADVPDGMPLLSVPKVIFLSGLAADTAPPELRGMAYAMRATTIYPMVVILV
jgi:hypothetical protein